MTTTIPLTKARVHLGDIIRRVRVNKERFILEKDGYPVAGIVDIDEMEDIVELENPWLKRDIRRSWREYKNGHVRDAFELLRQPLRKKTRARKK